MFLTTSKSLLAGFSELPFTCPKEHCGKSFNFISLLSFFSQDFDRKFVGKIVKIAFYFSGEAFSATNCWPENFAVDDACIGKFQGKNPQTEELLFLYIFLRRKIKMLNEIVT